MLLLVVACDKLTSSNPSTANQTAEATPLPSNIIGSYKSTSMGIKRSTLEITKEAGNIYIVGQWVMADHFTSNGEIPKQQIMFLDNESTKATLSGKFFWKAFDWGGEWKEQRVNFLVLDKDSLRLFSPENASATVVFTKTW